VVEFFAHPLQVALKLLPMFEIHLQAFNAFLSMCSLLPEYNERVLFMQALAPLAKLKDAVRFKTEDAKMVMKFVKVGSNRQYH